MKKNLLIASGIGLTLLGFAAGAYADSSLEQISAYINHDMHFKVNGTDWKPSSEPISYNGSTYLPVRSAAEAIGAQVGYDDASQTVSLDSPTSGGSISYAFTKAGDHPENILANLINEAKSSLDIAIYSITLPQVVDAIQAAQERGVAVRIVSDRTEAKTKSQAYALNKLAAAGIPIKINTHSGLMHLKVTIVDSKVFTTGSFNYSASASTTNDEVLLVDRDPNVAAKWEVQFERMWGDTDGFADFTSSDSTTSPPAENEGEASAEAAGATDVHFASCKEARAAGAAPLHRGDPGYSSSLDRDGDGIACES